MALGRLSVTVGHKGEASTWHDYVMREGIHAPKANDKERVILKEHGNMPYWVKEGDEKFFWEMADDKEPYQNGTTYRQHIVSLPRGLTDEQLIALGRKHIEKHNQGRFAYTMAIHCPIGMDGKEQPHLHYMFNEKIIDGIERGADTYFKRYNAKNPHKGGGKKDNTGLTHEQRDIQLQEVRNQWQVTCNEFLAEIDSNERIDMRNWKDRGETERPVNISMKAMFNAEVKQAYLDKLNTQAMLETAVNDLELIDLDTELSKAQTRLAEQIARFEHHQGIQSRLEKLGTYDNATLTQAELKPFDKATYDNIVTYEPKALEKINEIIVKVNMGEPLSKANETDYRYARAFLNHTAQMRIDGSLEQLRQSELAPIVEQSPPVATVAPVDVLEKSDKGIEQAPPTASPVAKSKQSQPPVKRDVIAEYESKRTATAKEFWKKELQSIAGQGKPYLDEYNELSKKQSLWGKVATVFDELTAYESRAERAKTALDNYNDYKRQFDELKKNGVNSSHLEQADTELKRIDPDLYNQYQSIINTQKQAEQAERDRLQREFEQRLQAEQHRQATAHANRLKSLGVTEIVDINKPSRSSYIGAVVKVDGNGLYQKVGNDTVLHPHYANFKGFEIGQYAKLDYDGKGKTTAYDGNIYNVSHKDKQQEQEKGR